MRDVEIVSSLALILSPKEQRFGCPLSELTRLWKIVLLNQFHDVLPGSSINAVRQIFVCSVCFYVFVARPCQVPFIAVSVLVS